MCIFSDHYFSCGYHFYVIKLQSNYCEKRGRCFVALRYKLQREFEQLTFFTYHITMSLTDVERTHHIVVFFFLHRYKSLDVKHFLFLDAHFKNP